MDPSSLEVRFGRYHDLLGPVRRSDEFAFVFARVELTGSGLTNGPTLEDYLENHDVSPEANAIIRAGEDAPWVCGRILQTFLATLTPADERAEKCCMEFGFLSIYPDGDRLVGAPFYCTDYYGRTILIFSEDAPDAATQDRLAAAFWRLLLESPNDLTEYTDRFDHLGAGVEIEFGVRDGEPYMREVD